MLHIWCRSWSVLYLGMFANSERTTERSMAEGTSCSLLAGAQPRVPTPSPTPDIPSDGDWQRFERVLILFPELRDFIRTSSIEWYRDAVSDDPNDDKPVDRLKGVVAWIECELIHAKNIMARNATMRSMASSDCSVEVALTALDSETRRKAAVYELLFTVMLPMAYPTLVHPNIPAKPCGGVRRGREEESNQTVHSLIPATRECSPA
jgi:hypothetical protein